MSSYVDATQRFQPRTDPGRKLTSREKAAVDDRETPATVFNPLHQHYGFTIDVAASVSNAKLDRYYTIDNDGLAHSWGGERVWCNPPYVGLDAWTAKAWDESALVVMLLPANRTEQRWWQTNVEPYRDRPCSRLSTEFLNGRLEFMRPGGRRGHVPFGCVLVVWKPRCEICRGRGYLSSWAAAWDRAPCPGCNDVRSAICHDTGGSAHDHDGKPCPGKERP